MTQSVSAAGGIELSDVFAALYNASALSTENGIGIRANLMNSQTNEVV